jgi:hypothetical protein
MHATRLPACEGLDVSILTGFGQSGFLGTTSVRIIIGIQNFFDFAPAYQNYSPTSLQLLIFGKCPQTPTGVGICLLLIWPVRPIPFPPPQTLPHGQKNFADSFFNF